MFRVDDAVAADDADAGDVNDDDRRHLQYIKVVISVGPAGGFDGLRKHVNLSDRLALLSTYRSSCHHHHRHHHHHHTV